MRAVDPWHAEIEAFLDCVEREQPPEQGTGEQARLGLAVSLVAARSLETGRPRRSRRRGAPQRAPRIAPSDGRRYDIHFLTFAWFALTHFSAAFAGSMWSPAIHFATRF